MSDVIYLPQAKWKAGERRAFKTSSTLGHRIVPAFKIPPSGGFDADEQRVLSPTEYLSRFGHQLAESRGRQLAFVDAELVDDEKHRDAVGVHPLTELLERARLSGAMAGPLFSRASSPDYKAAAARFLQRNESTPACLRIGLQELEELTSASELASVAQSVGIVPDRTVLLVDGGPLQINDAEDFAHLLIFQLSRLISRGTWLRVFWSATTLPNVPKAKAGEVMRFPRLDWRVYEIVLALKDQLSVVPMFSDYLLEYPSHYAPLAISPTAKLWYSSSNDYILAKGRSTKVDAKYENIFPVAKHLTEQVEMAVDVYSAGDAYIHRLSGGSGKSGNASMWRWCSTDHHLALVEEQLTRALGIPRLRQQPAISPEQLQLV